MRTDRTASASFLTNVVPRYLDDIERDELDELAEQLFGR